MTASFHLVSFSIRWAARMQTVSAFRASIALVSAAKNDVGKRLNFSSRPRVAICISPQVQTFRFGTALGRFKGLQSGLEWKLVLGNQQADHFTQFLSSRNPVACYQFLPAWFHGVTSRKRLQT
jgi:hypothetical protein